mgnify:FL=1
MAERIVGQEFTDGQSNVFVRQMVFTKAGDKVHGHAHNFPHMTYVVKGIVRVKGPKQTVTINAQEPGNWLLIPAGVEHELTAMVDDCLAHCIYAHRTPQGEVSQMYTGWRPAYE